MFSDLFCILKPTHDGPRVEPLDRVEHEGIVPEDKFIQVQELLAAKKDKPRRGAIASTVAVGKTAEVLIGVGPAETIDTLSVRWPTGETQTFANLPVDATITITEGESPDDQPINSRIGFP